METSVFYIPDREIDGFINALTDSNLEESRAAVYGLKSMGAQAMERLAYALQLGDPALRLQVVQIVADLRNEDAALLLVGTLEDEHVGVRRAAAECLLNMPQEALLCMLRRLAAGSASARLSAGILHVLRGLPETDPLDENRRRLIDALNNHAPAGEMAALARAALEEMA